MALQRDPSQIYHYLKKYQDEPGSRVFAPLAEAYRKAGLIDEAIQIARDGVREHPKFVGGRVALSRALFDKKLYQEVVEELAPLVQDVPDNLVAQRLLAESYLLLGRIAESLDSYKMLLYFSPQDTETSQLVHELEAQAYEGGSLVLRTDAPGENEFAVVALADAIEQDPVRNRQLRIARIERLQSCLQNLERYRAQVRQASSG